MNNNKNLYFVHIIAKALESSDLVESMKSAIKEIINLGELEEYKEGYANFNEFVKEGLMSSTSEKKIDTLLDKFITMLLSEDLEISEDKRKEILGKIKGNPTLFERYKNIKEKYFEQIPLEIEIYSEGIKINSEIIDDDTSEITIRGITPGEYSLSLSNGRLLWEGIISSEEVVWAKAFPKENYPMAADTGERDIVPTKMIEVIPKEIIMLIYAGLETGKMVLKINR